MRPSENPYVNISCDLYDQLEAYAMKAVKLKIVITNDSGAPSEVTSKICDLQTKKKEEFALLENDQWVRLDLIVSLTPGSD